MKLRRPWVLLFSTSVVAGAIAMACSDDSPTIGAAPDTGGLSPDTGTGQQDGAQTTNDGAQNPIDGSVPDGSEPIEDGGSDAEIPAEGGGLPPEDDGGTDSDAGFDAGPACAPLTPGPYITSICDESAARLGGGTFTTTQYRLTAVRAYGGAGYCGDAGVGGTYVAFDHRGALNVTALTPTTAVFEFLDEYHRTGQIVRRPTSVRYDAAAVAGKVGTLTLAPQACAASPAPASGGFAIGATKLGKKVIVLRLPYGRGGIADFTFTEQ